jgi:hypothetical protein
MIKVLINLLLIEKILLGKKFLNIKIYTTRKIK